jgi:hypothetical protein
MEAPSEKGKSAEAGEPADVAVNCCQITSAGGRRGSSCHWMSVVKRIDISMDTRVKFKFVCAADEDHFVNVDNLHAEK